MLIVYFCSLKKPPNILPLLCNSLFLFSLNPLSSLQLQTRYTFLFYYFFNVFYIFKYKLFFRQFLTYNKYRSYTSTTLPLYNINICLCIAVIYFMLIFINPSYPIYFLFIIFIFLKYPVLAAAPDNSLCSYRVLI